MTCVCCSTHIKRRFFVFLTRLVHIKQSIVWVELRMGFFPFIFTSVCDSEYVSLEHTNSKNNSIGMRMSYVGYANFTSHMVVISINTIWLRLRFGLVWSGSIICRFITPISLFHFLVHVHLCKCKNIFNSHSLFYGETKKISWNPVIKVLVQFRKSNSGCWCKCDFRCIRNVVPVNRLLWVDYKRRCCRFGFFSLLRNMNCNLLKSVCRLHNAVTYKVQRTSLCLYSEHIDDSSYIHILLLKSVARCKCSFSRAFDVRLNIMFTYNQTEFQEKSHFARSILF